MRIAKVIICSIFAVVCVPLPQAQSCSHAQDPTFYSDQNYKVRSARITSPFDFVSAIKRNERDASEHLPLTGGMVFQNSSYSKGIDSVKQVFRFPGGPSPLKLRVILPKIENCDESSSRELEVDYRVFLSNPLDYLQHPGEFTQSQISRPASTVAQANAYGRLVPSMAVAYNRTIGLSAGGSLKVLFPGSWGWLGVNVLESGAAHHERVDWSRSRRFEEPEFDALNLQVGYEHSDEPTDNSRIKFAHLFAQAYANTKELPSTHISFRYGGALEGGYQQSSGIDTAVLPSLVASQSYGDLKAYGGLMFSLTNMAISASYAIQAATDAKLSRVTFVKHIADVSIMSQIPLRQLERPGEVHHPLNIEWELAGGFLQRMGTMPVSQRFFGGNAWQQFTSANDWKIASEPFIRSIPENRLNSSSIFGTSLGGSSFWSSTFTLSLPIWGYPLIPKDLAKDPTFEPTISAEKLAAKNTLILTYEKDLPAFRSLLARLPELDTVLSQLKSETDSIAARVPSKGEEPIKAAQSAISSTARTSKDVQSTSPQAARALILGPVSRLSKLTKALDALSTSLRDARKDEDASRIESYRNEILKLQTSLGDDLQKIDLTIPEKRANDDLRVVDPVLNSILHKLNVVSVSPVAVFDVARLWPDAGRTRIGPGTGVRFAIVTFNVTLGYAWNVHGLRSEGPGAMFFSLDVGDIFH